MSGRGPSANDELAALIESRQNASERHLDTLSDVEATNPFLVMRLSDRWFALRAESVREVVARETITRVPGQPPHIRGVALLHGRLVPVAALDILLGSPMTAPGEAGESPAEGGMTGRRLVVLSREDTEVALMADDARGVIYLPVAFETRGGAERASFVAGEVHWEQHLVCVIDVPALMDAATQPERA